jgi:hypothetical protein
MAEADKREAELWRPAWLASDLDVDVSCVHRWIRQGKIAVVITPGNRYMIPREEVRRIKRAGYVTPGRSLPAIPARTAASAGHQAAMEALRKAGIG